MDERRTAGLLILLVVGQLALLGLQIPAESGSGTLLGSLGLRVLAPLARGVENVGDGLSGVGQDLRLKGTVLAENRRLEREIERLRLELLRFREVRGEAQRLAKALRYEAPPLGSLRVADVVYLDDSALSTTLVVYVGQTPTFRNQTVLAARGLVGRVIEPASPYARVQLITDSAAAVGAYAVRTRRQGIVRGSGRGRLTLDYVPLQSDVQVGDHVLTAGIDGVFPRGIPIGVVKSVEPGRQLFHQIQVTPIADLTNLDQVYLLDYQPLPEALREGNPDARR